MTPANNGFDNNNGATVRHSRFAPAQAGKVLVLDGGFGTMLQEIASDITGQHVCNDNLCVTHPDVVARIHRMYLDAGADIIETNSFNANAISLEEYGLADKAYDISLAAARIARAEADRASTPDKPRYVAGSVGPTNRTLSMSADVSRPDYRDVSFDAMYQAYTRQVQGLVDGGVDAILIETVFDTLNAKAAIAAVRDIDPDFPIMISATVSDTSGRTLTGQTIEAFVASVMHARPVSIGLNCGFGASHLLPHLRRLAAIVPTAVSVHPNAGLPNISGQYDETPETFTTQLRAYFDENLVNIVGGCCGTTPHHIRALAQLAAGRKPRVIPANTHKCTLSGLEHLDVVPEANFLNIGERTNVAGSAKFARLIREEKYDEALSIARAQVDAGARIIDICMDAPMIDAAAAMTRFLNLIASEPEIARVPLMIDSSDIDVVYAALKCVQGKSVVNSISLKEGEERFVERARNIMRYGAAVVVMLFDENGQADTYARKVEIAERAYNLLTGIGFPAEDIIFDPNILAVATGIESHDRYARDFIDATRWIKQNLPGAKVSGGVSNLSFAFRGNNTVRKAMHSVFLYHAIKAGMDMAIVNPQMLQLYTDIDARLLEVVEDVILYRQDGDVPEGEGVGARLADFARTLVDDKGATVAAAPDDAWRSGNVAARIEHALLHGDTSYIADDALEAVGLLGGAAAVIDVVLMPAMAKVGALFADGRMFLPQVVKSARVMKLAVAAIEPALQAESAKADGAERRNTVVIATVKGDVHDIGKNIVALVLACNGFDVRDLGVMVPAETIIDTAVDTGACAICLSGLITPSLHEMAEVVRMAQERGLGIPIVVGGATTSALHTAVKMAPLYNGLVAHSTDAAENASLLSALMADKGGELLKNIQIEQEAMRERHAVKKTEAQTVAHKVQPCACCGGTAATVPHAHVYTPAIDEVAEKINYDWLLAGWGIRGRIPDVYSHPERGAEARRVVDDAQTLLQRMQSACAVRLFGVTLTCRASADGDDIVLHGVAGDGGDARLPMLRNESTGESLADMVDGEATLFLLTAGIGLDGFASELRAATDDYSAIMAKLLCDRLVEAFADTVLPGGCRVAFGYPSAPDHSLKADVFDLLDIATRAKAAGIDISLTDNYMIVPAESICGIMLPNGHFVDVGVIGAEQLSAYSAKRGIDIERMKNIISKNVDL